MAVDYARLSLAEVSAGLDAIAREAEMTFGALDARQLNWKPDPARWSVAQCFEHLVTANALMNAAADLALAGAAPRSIWQRLPVWPRLLGRIMVTSQGPNRRGKFKAPSVARPASSDVAGDIVQRFAEQQREFAVKIRALDDARAARTIMTSPFARVVTYRVLDGWRLVLAHGQRHVEQARRVTGTAGFPRSG